MRTLIFLAALAAATPALAADLTAESVLGKTSDEVKASLTEMGYDIRKMETEDGKIEVYVVKDGKMAEVYVDPATGKVAKLEMK